MNRSTRTAQAPEFPTSAKITPALLQREHGMNGLSWQAVADKYDLPSRSAAWNIAHGKQPPPNEKRQAAVRLLNGIVVKPGALVVIGSQPCVACSTHFIPNHPRRAYCPQCRPPKTKGTG